MEQTELENQGPYPVFYKGKYWNKEDCKGLFEICYTSRVELGYAGYDGGIYISDGLVAFPDGSTIDTKSEK